MECPICGNTIQGPGNNGEPLVKGRVCNDCNWKVIKERLKLAQKHKNLKATESVEPESLLEVDLQGGPVNVTDPMADFEKYAEQFEKTFILGKTPVRKEKPVNSLKVKDGVIEGEISSMDKGHEPDQVDPSKSATEALYGFSEIYEFMRICKELGINTFGEVQKFADEHPGDLLEELRKYRDSLGSDWKNKDLSEEDEEELGHLRVKEAMSWPQKMR